MLDKQCHNAILFHDQEDIIELQNLKIFLQKGFRLHNLNFLYIKNIF